MKKCLILLILFSTDLLATPVNVNTADAQTIADSLKNIGVKKAEAIIAYRNKNGTFKTLGDLGLVSGVGDKTIEQNKADILFSDTAPAPEPTAPASPEAPAGKAAKNK